MVRKILEMSSVDREAAIIYAFVQWVAMLSQKYKQAWLPGLSQKESQAVKMVHKIVHYSVKWDKGILCGCFYCQQVLKNIVGNSITRVLKGPILTLNQLYAHELQPTPSGK
ncbi:hypothetical protein VP01_434g3 [Puccinia sorghi]|uniref:Uncharacterized protein n=1 Tax=Puccinia sorghi TaxID=27349 RepID=A0A0L6UPV7_9BASI|nr:hypothetical protein VP01_434g3 [Puccinia sorghi]